MPLAPEENPFLGERGIRVGLGRPIPLGIMVESPAAVLPAGQFARKADFFSMDINDLTQYTPAMGRRLTATGWARPSRPWSWIRRPVFENFPGRIGQRRKTMNESKNYERNER